MGVCYVTATVEWGKRRLQKKYEKKSGDEGAMHPLDGAYVYPGVVPPDDDQFA